MEVCNGDSAPSPPRRHGKESVLMEIQEEEDLLSLSEYPGKYEARIDVEDEVDLDGQMKFSSERRCSEIQIGSDSESEDGHLEVAPMLRKVVSAATKIPSDDVSTCVKCM